MKKLILRTYGVTAILLCFLFFYGLLNLRLNLWREDAMTGYGEITEYVYNEISVPASEESPLGIMGIMEFTLTNVRSDFDTLLFLTNHQNVKVYLEENEVCSLKAIAAPLVPKSPGSVYNEVVFEDGDNGKTVRIELSPVYKNTLEEPELMLGNGYQIIKVILFQNLPILGLCFCVILIGVLQIIMA